MLIREANTGCVSPNFLLLFVGMMQDRLGDSYDKKHLRHEFCCLCLSDNV